MENCPRRHIEKCHSKNDVGNCWIDGSANEKVGIGSSGRHPCHDYFPRREMEVEVKGDADGCSGGATADDGKSPNDRFVRTGNRRYRHRLSRAADESGRPARQFTLI